MEERVRKRGDVSSKSKAVAALEAVKAQEPIGVIGVRPLADRFPFPIHRQKAKGGIV